MSIFKPLLFLVLLHAPFATASDVPPRKVANSFYTWVIEYDRGGLPPSSALKAGKPVLSRELLRLLGKAAVVERRCVAKTPRNLKPQIFEGSLFVDNYEGISKVISLDLQATDSGILVSSRLEYKDPRWNVEAIEWPDQLALVREKGNWVVGDIKRPTTGSSLLVILKDYIRSACP